MDYSIRIVHVFRIVYASILLPVSSLWIFGMVFQKSVKHSAYTLLMIHIVVAQLFMILFSFFCGQLGNTIGYRCKYAFKLFILQIDMLIAAANSF